MPQCANGSQVKAGAPTSFFAGGIPFINWLTTRLSTFAAILGTVFPDQLYLTANFCANEPPVLPPAPALQDYANALISPGSLSLITDYWTAAYLASVWPTYCECSPGGAPAGSLEAYILGQGPAIWWKLNDAAGHTSAADSADSNSAGMALSYAFNAPKILPNASGTCLSMTGAGLNMNRGSSVNLPATTGQFTYVQYTKLTAGTGADLLMNYNGSQPQYIEVGILADGRLHVICNDSGNVMRVGVNVSSGLNDGNVHLIITDFDMDAGTLNIWRDNGVNILNTTFPAHSVFWPTTGNMGAGLIASSSTAYQGYAQDWAIFTRNFDATLASQFWFNAGLGGGSAFIPPTPTPPAGGPTSAPPGFPGSTTADVLAALNILEQKLDNLIRYGSVAASTSIALHTVHAGLSNAFSLPSVGLVGVVVDVTTVPTKWGRTTETPARYIPRLGQVVLEYAAEFGVPRDLDLLHSLILFPPGPVDTIQFTLEPGIVAKVTEVIRGP